MELFVGLIATESLSRHKSETLHNLNFFQNHITARLGEKADLEKHLLLKHGKPELGLSRPTLNP